MALNIQFNTQHSTFNIRLSHLPNHRQDQRPASHFFSEVALEHRAHLFLKEVGVAKLVGRTFVKDANERGADLVEDVLALVDVYEAAGDDLRIANEPAVRVDRYDDDHESILGEMLPVPHHDLRHFLGLGVD